MRYVTKVRPQYSKLYQPSPKIQYQGSCFFEGSFASIPSDCTMYSQCVDGKFIKVSCENGLHWNSALSVCDWPKNAKCNRSPAAGIQESGDQEQGAGGSTDDVDVTLEEKQKGKF